MLSRIYFSNGGPKWNNISGWLGLGDICTTWCGVSCDANRNVDPINVLASNILGNADCNAFTNDADTISCKWITNSNNHQLGLNSRTYTYIAVSSVEHEYR